MKKIIIAAFLIIALMLPVSAFGAGSCSKTMTRVADGFVIVELSCTGDSGDGSIPKQEDVFNATMAAATGAWYLYQVETRPGATAPDAADVTVNMNGQDLLGGKGVNLIHASATYDTLPYSTFMSAYRYPPVTSSVSVAVANQGTASAKYTIKLTFSK
jgi:hypothetical protein